MGRNVDKKFPIVPSTTKKGTTLNSAAALDSPSVLSKLVTPAQPACSVTTTESEITYDDTSTVLDETGSLGPFLDATIAKSTQIENAEIPDENAETPVNSPEFTRDTYDERDDMYVDLDDALVEEINGMKDVSAIKNLLKNILLDIIHLLMLNLLHLL